MDDIVNFKIMPDHVDFVSGIEPKNQCQGQGAHRGFQCCHDRHSRAGFGTGVFYFYELS